MKNICHLIFCALLVVLFTSNTGSAQGLLKKAGQRLGREAGRMLDKDKNTNTQDNSNQNNPNPSINQNQGAGNGVEGNQPSFQTKTSSTGRKKMTPPDVKKSMADAEASYTSKNYDDTRYNVRQAITGIEIEIGYQILDSLPKSIDGMDYKDEDDQVISSGYGFAGFNVERSYYNKAEKSLDISILNNETMSSGINMILSNPGYMSSNGNQKAVKVGSYRAVLNAEDNGKFSLSIPLGQSSLIIMSLNDYKDENEVIQTAGKFDIAGIKTMLGEQ